MRVKVIFGSRGTSGEMGGSGKMNFEFKRKKTIFKVGLPQENSFQKLLPNTNIEIFLCVLEALAKFDSKRATIHKGHKPTNCANCFSCRQVR